MSVKKDVRVVRTVIVRINVENTAAMAAVAETLPEHYNYSQFVNLLLREAILARTLRGYAVPLADAQGIAIPTTLVLPPPKRVF